MSNMSYVRNRNTLKDLRQVKDSVFTPESKEERDALLGILEECAQILSKFGVDTEEDAFDRALEKVKMLNTGDDEELGDD